MKGIYYSRILEVQMIMKQRRANEIELLSQA
jgi:hypothetical protein